MEIGSARQGGDAPNDAAPKHGDDATFLVLGERPAILSGENLQSVASSPYAGIILTSRIEPAELTRILDQARDPAVPIADFGDNQDLRRDFVGARLDAASLAAVKAAFAPIWRRLGEQPFRAPLEDRVELTTLRLAYSRDAPIEARYAPNQPLAVRYPLLGAGIAVRRRLEFLASVDLLRRRHFTRTHACGRCGSARLNAFEACPACGAADLTEEAIVHHYRCGWQAPESRFKQGQQLICPKCHRELRHLGVDYGKPGTAVVCGKCGAANAEPVVHFACLDCSSITAGADAKTVDWYHYDLTEHGIEALREGKLPRFDIAPLLKGLPRAFSMPEFRLLATEGIRVAQRYGRPFAAARLLIANVEALRRDQGPIELDGAFHLVVESIVDALRAADFVSADTESSVVIGFPETNAADVAAVVERIRATLRNSVAATLEIEAEIAEADAIDDLLKER